MNQIDKNAQYRSNQKLLAAVIALAVEDAQLVPINMGGIENEKRPTDFAITAMRFLFTTDLDGYLAALDMNANKFRERLLHTMYYTNTKPKDPGYKRHKAFKFNYEYYYKNHARFNYDLLYKDHGGI